MSLNGTAAKQHDQPYIERARLKLGIQPPTATQISGFSQLRTVPVSREICGMS
jgi:hypothetical protein